MLTHTMTSKIESEPQDYSNLESVFTIFAYAEDIGESEYELLVTAAVDALNNQIGAAEMIKGLINLTLLANEELEVAVYSIPIYHFGIPVAFYREETQGIEPSRKQALLFKQIAEDILKQLGIS